jgi:arylsulfatase A
MRTFLPLLAVLAFVGGAGYSAQAPARAPNIVVFLIDDLGWADLSCQGSRYYQTPNIDRLASQGVRFTQAYAAAAICSPTRAALLTGRHPVRLGITDWIRPNIHAGNRPPQIPSLPGFAGTASERLACPINAQQLPLEEHTLAESLKSAGYVTCHIGKWHLGDEGFWPTEHGFDFNYGGAGFGLPPSYFDPYNSRLVPGGLPGLAPRREGEYLTDREADEAVGFIRRHRDRPFLLHIWHHAVHTPIQAKAELVDVYEQRPRTIQTDATYAAMVHSMDESVGRVMDALQTEGLAGNTLVIFTSDNGGLDGLKGRQAGRPTDNAPLRWGKGHPYEGGLRVPLIVRWPGVTRPGTIEETPAVTMDLFSTALDAAGVRPPADRPVDGRSLRTVLGGTADPAPRTLYWHFPHYGGDDRIPYSVIRHGPWKLIRFYDSDHVELYNLVEDFSEERNLATARPETAAELIGKLDHWLRETGARMPQPNPLYVR